MPGTARVDWNDRKVRQLLTNTLMRNSRKAGRDLVRDVKADLGKRRVSEPGQPPGRRSGRLLKSIKHVVRRSRSRGIIYILVGSANFVARFHEKGTRRMAARPILFRKFAANLGRMVSTILHGR